MEVFLHSPCVPSWCGQEQLYLLPCGMSLQLYRELSRSLPQEINAYAHHRPLLTAGNNLTVFEKLFQM